MSDPEATVEVVRDRLDEERADQVLRFWSREGALEGEAARQRLPAVACLALDGSGEIVGVNSVTPEEVPLIGGRRFWVHRSLIPEDPGGELWPRIFNTAFEAMEREFEATDDGPVGLCVVVSDRAEMERHPEVIRADTGLMFAGYPDDHRQLWIRYFDGALIGPPGPGHRPMEKGEHEIVLDEGYGIERFADTDFQPDDVIDLWLREGVVPSGEAQRRVHEVLMVAVEDSEGVVGVSTAYLQRNPQLRMDLWYSRVFVAAAHRGEKLSFLLARRTRDWLKQRFVSGEDVRGAGMFFEIEYEGFKTHYPEAFWEPTSFAFIGENERGDHLRIHYFPGARVPLPRARA